jgi:hypothetical protein
MRALDGEEEARERGVVDGGLREIAGRVSRWWERDAQRAEGHEAGGLELGLGTRTGEVHELLVGRRRQRLCCLRAVLIVIIVIVTRAIVRHERVGSSDQRSEETVEEREREQRGLKLLHGAEHCLRKLVPPLREFIDVR